MKAIVVRWFAGTCAIKRLPLVHQPPVRVTFVLVPSVAALEPVALAPDRR
jgi:hypothetical protein